MASLGQVVALLKELTGKAQALRLLAQSIDVVDVQNGILGQGPVAEIIAGLSNIVSTTSAALADRKEWTVAASDHSDATLHAYREASTFP